MVRFALFANLGHHAGEDGAVLVDGFAWIFAFLGLAGFFHGAIESGPIDGPVVVVGGIFESADHSGEEVDKLLIGFACVATVGASTVSVAGKFAFGGLGEASREGGDESGSAEDTCDEGKGDDFGDEHNDGGEDANDTDDEQDGRERWALIESTFDGWRPVRGRFGFDTVLGDLGDDGGNVIWPAAEIGEVDQDLPGFFGVEELEDDPHFFVGNLSRESIAAEEESISALERKGPFEIDLNGWVGSE